MSNTLRKGLSAAVLVALVIGYLIDAGNEVGGINQADTGDRAQRPTTYTRRSDGDQVAAAFAARQSDVQVRGAGHVIRVLADDREGSRHQRFILRLDHAATLLIAHNIDLAPRIPHLAEGDHVEFFGEYEYNDRGGVVHWTHHDPAGRHPHGWLKHQGKLYQ